MSTAIQKAAQAQIAPAQEKAKQRISVMVNSFLDGEKMRARFDELLGKRTPQFLSSLVSMISDNEKLQQAFTENPMSVIKSALQAASYDLPIDPTLGFAYIVPFKTKVKTKNGDVYKMTATFVPGYKGMIQLCLRTGAYERIPDAVDVREGELVRYDRLTGDCEFRWIEDEEERDKLPVIGYAGFFRLKNGAEKTIYMTVKQIEAHEKKNRKGQYMSPLWRDDFDSMARKTVIRRLCSKYALMSIDYLDGSRDTVNLATAVAQAEVPENVVDIVEDEEIQDAEFTPIETDPGTGEVIEGYGSTDDGKLPWEENA